MRLKIILLNLSIFINFAGDDKLIDNLYSIFVDKLNYSNCRNETANEFNELNVILNNILKKYSNIKPNNVVECSDLSNINIFCDDSSELNNNFLKKINRCKTSIGKYILAYMLSNPTANLNEILGNQYIIKLLLKNHNIKLEVENLILIFSKIEKGIIDFYSEESTMSNRNIDKRIIKRFYFKNRNNSNRNVKTLYSRKIFTDLVEIMVKPYYSGLSIVLYLTAFFMMFDNITDNLFLKLSQFVPIPAFKEIVIIINIGKIINALNKKKSIIAGGLFIGGIVSNIYSFINMYRKFKSYKRDYKKIFDIVKTFQTFIKATNKLLRLIEKNEDCRVILNKIKSIEALHKSNNSYELNWIIRFLFGKDLSCTYLSHNAPSVLATFNILNYYRDVFINVLCEFAQMDTYLSMCNLISENSEAFSFTKFINSNKPIIILKDLWSPLINNSNLIKNDLEIGKNFNTMLLCGHNGAGKSTYLRSIMLNLILIQTFGLSMSKYSKITIFNKFNISLDVNNDAKIGDSLFKSEIKKLSHYLKSCKDTINTNKFIFSIFEEPLKGTDSRSAISILLGIFKYLNKTNSNLINIISSHHNKLAELGKLPMFKNFYPDVKINKDNRLIYLYKIKQGFSNISLAIPISEQMGIDNDIIKLIKSEYSSHVS